MAPELFDEGATHSTASDLWAAGCVLYECLTGDPPFVRRTLAQLMSAILHEEPAPLGQGVSEECRDLVMRLLDKNPLTRITWEVRIFVFFLCMCFLACRWGDGMCVCVLCKGGMYMMFRTLSLPLPLIHNITHNIHHTQNHTASGATPLLASPT